MRRKRNLPIYRLPVARIFFLKKLKKFCRFGFSWIYGLYDINMGAIFLEKNNNADKQAFVVNGKLVNFILQRNISYC